MYLVGFQINLTLETWKFLPTTDLHKHQQSQLDTQVMLLIKQWDF